MEFLLFLLLGGIAGYIASVLMGTDASQGILLNVVVGVVGAFVGGLIFNAFGVSGATGFNLYSLVVATLGAVALIWLVRLLRGASR